MLGRLLAIAISLFLLLGFVPDAPAQAPNAQLLCFNLEPPSNQKLSPGLNRGHAEGFWIRCQGVIDGQARDTADAESGGLNDGLYRSMFLLPTYSQRNNENGISDIAAGENGIRNLYGAGDVTPVPAGHPEDDGMTFLGAVSDTGACGAPVIGAPTFHEGASLFAGPSGGNQSVIGVIVPVDLTCPADAQRIDLSFAIRLAPDRLQKITGGLSTGRQQGFPGTTFGPPSPVSGAAGYFSGPGPLFVGYFVGDPTGIATVPIKVLEAEQEFSSISGHKFCDTDLDGNCAGEHLVDGVTIKVTMDTFAAADQIFFLTTGSPGLQLERQGNSVVTNPLPMAPGTGEYEMIIDCRVFPKSGTVLTIEEIPVPPAGFTDQTAPGDDADNSDRVTASGGVYTVELNCNEDRTDLNFGNVTIRPSDADPHTIGFWGASLIKSAINSSTEAHAQCGKEEAPGGNDLPVSDGMTTYNTPEEVAALIDAAADGCAAFDSTINAVGTDVEDLLCEGAGHLPPKQFDNPRGQLLGYLLNIQSGLLPEGTLVDLSCLGFPNGLVPAGDIAADACNDPDAFQAVLDAINNQTPGVDPYCLVEVTCPAAVLLAPTCP